MIEKPPPKSAPLNHIKVTQSLQGVALPLVFGTARVSPKLIYDADLTATKQQTAGGKSKGGKSGMYTYFATFIGALCQGPILGVLGMWDQQGMLPLVNQQVPLGTIPLTAPQIILSIGAGGSLPARTYFAYATYVYGNSEGAHGPESPPPGTIPANYLATIISPIATAGATGWNVYVGTASGNETLQNSSPIPIGTNWTEPTSGLINTGATAPTQPVVPVTPPGPVGGGAGDTGANNWHNDTGVGDSSGRKYSKVPIE